MGLFERLQSIDRKFAIQFLLAITLGPLAVYTAFFQRKAPELRFETVSSASVFSVTEEVGKLDVLFNGVNVRERKQALTLITFIVSNPGDESITKASYDEKDLVGFNVSEGEIIRADLLTASSDYLKANVEINAETNAATFAPVIIDAGESFAIKVLILHSEKGVPVIKPRGKVAGVKRIAHVSSLSQASEDSFLKRVFQGSLFVQLLRLLAYTAIALLLLLSALLFEDRWENWRGRKKRKVLADVFREHNDVPEQYAFVLDDYVSKGPHSIRNYKRLLVPSTEDKARKHAIEVHHEVIAVDLEQWEAIKTIVEEKLLRHGLLAANGDYSTINPDFVPFVEKLINFTTPKPKEKGPGFKAPSVQCEKI